MKANENTVLIGSKVVLVPYDEKHVQKYHRWMESQEIRSLTASEQLTLEEEYDMQRQWRLDEDKLTFIILARTNGATGATGVKPTDARIQGLEMVGDVNVFFSGHLGLEAAGSSQDEENEFSAELEIMIAEAAYRRGGFATESLRLMCRYVTGSIFPVEGHWDTFSPEPSVDTLPSIVHPSSLVVKVGDKNTPSIKLFEKFGFKVVKHVKVFEEVEMRLDGFGSCGTD